MRRIAITLIIAWLLPAALIAQVSPERAAWKALSKHRWERSQQALKRALRKDSLNATAHYVMAWYFFETANPSFHVDSAHQYAVAAQNAFNGATARQREKLMRFPLDSVRLVRLRSAIDSAGFARACRVHTEQAYLDFIRLFPGAQQQAQAADLRDAVAYADAVATGTYPAFQAFIARYPYARQVPEARDHYERLLFEDHTRDRRLASYERFLLEYPQSSYREEVEFRIFGIITAPGTAASFGTFLHRYPHSRAAARARAILFHLLSDEQQLDLPPALQSDSLATVVAASQHYLVPFLHQGAFGFMDARGTQVMPPNDESLRKEYACGNIQDDVLVLPAHVVGRNGAILYRGHVETADDIGQGFLLLETDTCATLLHKSGWAPVAVCLQDARILAGRFLALKRNGLWAVYTLGGFPLHPFLWHDVSVADSLVVFRKDEKVWLATVGQLAALANQEPLPLKDAFDEIKFWPHGRLWARAGKFQGVFDRHLALFIPFTDEKSFTPYFSGILGKTPRGWTLYDTLGTSHGNFDTLRVSEPWVAAHANQTWRLFFPRHDLAPVASYDSIFFAGPFAVGLKKDTATVHLSKSKVRRFALPVKFEAVPGQDSSALLVAEQKEKKTAYNAEGRKLFTVPYDRIQDAGQGIFIVTQKDKKGLMDAGGKVLLPPEYDAIGTVKDGAVSLLKAMKFGAYHVKQKKLIKPTYGKNVVPYNAQTLVVYKNNHYGLIGWDDKPRSAMEFLDVKPWNDTVALVKKDYQWMLYEIKSRQALVGSIKDYKMLRDNAEGRLAIVHRDNNYGVIDSRRGVVIPFQFSDIVNVGSAEMPLYFTEKHVEEASLFVVIYYNSEGAMLRKEVYEHDDYEKIYCTGK